MYGSKEKHHDMWCDGSAQYSFEKFTTHLQEVINIISRYLGFVFQTSKPNTASTGTFWIMTFTGQEKLKFFLNTITLDP